MKTLVVGATGFAGMEVVRLLREKGSPVRALVRPSADTARQAVIRGLGAEIVAADLKEPESLRAACEGVDTIVSTASGIASRQPGDSIEAVDGAGQVSLVDEAERAGVRHFVFVSFPELRPDSPLQRAKRGVEARLRRGIPVVTLLQPVNLMEAWLGSALGFDPAHGSVRICGNGDRPVSWISFRDVARFAAAAAQGAPHAGRVLPLGGPEALTPLQVVKIFEELGSPEVAIQHVPEAALEQQLQAAASSLEQTFAAFMLTTARGLVVDPAPALQLLPGKMITVRDYALEMLGLAR